LDYISCSLFLENGDAVLQTFHLLAGIANCLAIGQLIRDGGMRSGQYCCNDPHKYPSHDRTHVCRCTRP
jgi:hypothetical protein